MATQYEYMVLNLFKAKEGWLIEYMGEQYSREQYMTAMLDYLGLASWQLVSSTLVEGEKTEEYLYFSRPFTKVTQVPKLQNLINEIDKRSNTNFADSALNDEARVEDSELLKQKVLKHLYDWLNKHEFTWGEPGAGVRESHYLNKMEDVSDDPIFPSFHGINKVSTRIDITKESNNLHIALKRRITGSWIDYSQFDFPYTPEGLLAIQNQLSMQLYKLLSN